MSTLRTDLDRLVDGELSPVEQRRVLTDVAAHSEGWKLCATAFLEAQTWRGEIKSITSPAEKAVPPIASAKPVSRFDSKQLYYLASLAASLGLAFFLGRGSIETRETNAMHGTNTAKTDSNEPFPAAQERRAILVQRSEGDSILRAVPLMEAAEIDPQSMFAWENVTRELAEAIRRGGDRVTHEQEFIPFELPDGRRAIVPVDRVHIVPVKTY